jgi:hypothetical protein
MNLIISQENAQRILDFLVSMPWKEVHEIVPLLLEVEPAPEKEIAPENNED